MSNLRSQIASLNRAAAGLRGGVVSARAKQKSVLTFADKEREFGALVSRAADESHRMLMQHPYESVFLWLVPSTETSYGRLVPVLDSDSPPSGATLVWNEKLPGNLERDQLRSRIHATARRLPVLPWGT